VINQALVAGDILFATNRDRCLYLGTANRDRPKWLADRPGSWRYVHDVLKEADLLVKTAAEVRTVEAGPNFQEDVDDVDNVALVDQRSLPHEPASLPTQVKASVTNGSMKAELLQSAEAAVSEAVGSQTETTPLEATGCKRGRNGGRQLKKQKLPAEHSAAGRKRSPALMRDILKSLRKRPILSEAAEKAGIHRKTLEYWIKCSAAGHKGYDIKSQGVTLRFHEHFEAAMHEADDKVVRALMERATGYDKIVTYRGRVIYQMDEFLLDLGYQGRDAYLKDKNGNPVPQTIRKVDTKAALWVLERRRPEVWGKNQKIDVPHQGGGVLVVGDVTKALKNSTAASIRARKWKSAARMIQKAKT
jgi:hypothetical protein